MVLKIRLAVGAGLVVLAGTLPVAMATEASPASTTSPQLAAGDVEVAWVLLGTASAGRQLVLGNVSHVPDCRVLRADLLSLGERTVDVRVVQALKPDADEFGCGTNAIQQPLDIVRIDLGDPLKGQGVRGPRRLRLASQRELIPKHDGAPRTWPVVGMSVADAVATLRGFGERRHHITVRGPKDGYVTETKPALPRALRHSRPITIVTQRPSR